MDGNVPHFLDGAKFGEEVGAEVLLKGLFVEEGVEAIVVGELEVGIVGVEPVDGLFEGVANVKATGSGRPMYQVFGMGGMVEEFGEVGFEKVEVAGHGCNTMYPQYNRKILIMLKLLDNQQFQFNANKLRSFICGRDSAMTESEQESLKRAAAALDTLLLEHGIDEDTLLAEFRQLRSSQR